ncbi:E3 ubiquitin- protein ligase upl1 [Tritrichomonas musculus]|uniref:HECT-type E3 ubiquitin transferase n=1 Tax=Tritrichomonas musculus TaxID=1915356 RepID=A0ABR2H1G6_9EUKA
MTMNDQANKNIVDFQNQIKAKVNKDLQINLVLNRFNIFEDSYNQLPYNEKAPFLGRFNIQFKDEVGIDAGSFTKEWIVLLMRDIVTKFFSCSPEYYYYPSNSSSELPDFQKYFEFSGKIFALALIHNISINVRFSTFFLKHILRIPIDVEDIKNYDENLYKSLIFLKDNDPKDLDLYFETSVKTLRGFTDVDLIPNGGSIKVTNENKNEYIDTLTNYLLTKSIQQQIDAFCRGFDSLIPHNEIKNISIGDLQYLISARQIDVNDLKKRISFTAHSPEDSQAVQLFFDAISKWNNEDLEKLLMFVTCCYTIPLSGEIFSIEVSNGRNDYLPIAHTSFKRLILPKYASEEQLNQKFALALNTDSFDLF